MSMVVKFDEDISTKEWVEFFDSNAFASPFQSPGFYSLFNSVKNMSASAIAVYDSGVIRALAVITLQKEPGIEGFFSRRGIMYGGPLVDREFPEALGTLLEQISLKYYRKAIYLEIRNYSDYSGFRDIFHQHGFHYSPYLNFRLPAGDLNSMTAAVSESRMRQIKKALRGLVTWREAQTREEVIAFYEILSQLYRDKIRKPLLPVDFFINFFDSGPGKYLLVWYRGKIIGGILCPILEGRVIYEFYVCGLDNEYKEQYPSIMATWAAMEYAFQNNIPFMDFMGAGLPDKKYGVRDFKARFGGELVEYGRFTKIYMPILFTAGKLAISLKGTFKK